jgi:hypothetical protein
MSAALNPSAQSSRGPSPQAAAALRARCKAAAASLAREPRRAQLTWQDLQAWPAWAEHAERDPEVLEQLAWRAGVQWHACAWRRCIDGARLKALRERLGAEAFDALMRQETPDEDESAAASPMSLSDERLIALGREVMLAALPAPALRVVLRERFWPNTLPAVPAPSQARAEAAVRSAARTLQTLRSAQ